MLLHFPQMHPGLLPEALRAALPAGALFLDPGLTPAPAPDSLRPEGLPFDPRTARALLADALRYGESVADPRDIKAQGLAQQMEQAGGLSPESSRAVLAEVEQSVHGLANAGQAAVDPRDEALRQGQMLLLLAWSLEERVLEMRQIQGSLRTAWDRLGQSVAEGEGEADEESDAEALALGRQLSGLGLPGEAVLALPWRRLMEPFALLAPGAVLCSADPELAASLAEAGTPEAPAQEVTGAARLFRAPAWRLMGLDRLPPERPWLDAPLGLAFFDPAAG